MIKKILLVLALLCLMASAASCGGSSSARVYYTPQAQLYVNNFSRCAYDTIYVGPYTAYVDIYPGETWYIGQYPRGYYDVTFYDTYTGCTYYVFDVWVSGTTTLEIY